MKFSLKQELDAKKAKDNSKLDQDNALKSVKLLLAGEEAVDARILSNLGKNSKFSVHQNTVGEMLEIENLEKTYGTIYTIDQIRSLCIEYRLRFLNSNLYTGELDIEILSKIKQFAKESGVELNDANLKYQFYILAPASQFQTQKVSHNRLAWLQGDPDPIIFYKVDDKHYRFIHKWGSDFTIFRRLIGWKYEGPNNKRHFNFIVQLPILYFIACIIFGGHIIASNPIISLITIGVISYTLAVFRNFDAIDKKPFDYNNTTFSKNVWNNTNRN